MIFKSIVYYFHINSFKYHVSCTDGKIPVRIKLELPFFTSSHSIVVFFPVGLSSLSRNFQQFLLGVEVSVSLKLHHPTRPVENVMITTKCLQERTKLLNGTTAKKDNSNLNFTSTLRQKKYECYL